MATFREGERTIGKSLQQTERERERVAREVRKWSPMAAVEQRGKRTSCLNARDLFLLFPLMSLRSLSPCLVCLTEIAPAPAPSMICLRPLDASGLYLNIFHLARLFQFRASLRAPNTPNGSRMLPSNVHGQEANLSDRRPTQTGDTDCRRYTGLDRPPPRRSRKV